MSNLAVIIASTRPGRVGLPIGTWVAEAARAHGDFDVDLVDLVEVGLPFLDEPNHPAMRNYTKPHTLAWSERIDRADAFVFVMAEYNHSYPAPLKNAVDFLHAEWAQKPAAFVSYGGISGGTRAVTAFEPVLGALNVVVLPQAVPLPFGAKNLDDDGAFVPDERQQAAMEKLLAAVSRWSDTLVAHRAAQHA